jgi:hypothetical protein
MATIFIDYQTISWGAPGEDDDTDVWELEDSSSDPGQVQLANFGRVGDPVVGFRAQDPLGGYQFAFWNATDGTNALDGFPSQDPTLNIPSQPAGAILHATAWYVDPGGGRIGPPAMVLRTFDVDLNGFRKETPIASAAPAAAWSGPNSHAVVTATAAASATATPFLLLPAPLPTQPPGEPVKAWKRCQVLAGALTAVDTSVIGPEEARGLAVVFYGHDPVEQFIGPSLSATEFDYWAEFWGRRGAEGVGHWGPGGPSGPWNERIARMKATLSPRAFEKRLRAETEALRQYNARYSAHLAKRGE